MSIEATNLCFLSGLGDRPDAWSGVVSLLPPRWTITTLLLNDLCPLEGFSLDAAVDALATRLGKDSRHTHLIGLSAGAMIALRYAASHDIASLMISAPQIHPPRAAMAVQHTIFHLLPERIFTSSGISKEGMIAASYALAEANLVADAQRITAPTTILCGKKDRANLRASRLAHRLISGSRLVTVERAKHEWHRELPDVFARELTAHLRRLSPQREIPTTRLMS